MKGKKLTSGLGLIGLVLCCVAQPAAAFFGKETTGGTFLDSLVNKTAEGQIIQGTINVGYVIDPLETPCGPDGADITATMTVTLRVEWRDLAGEVMVYPFPFSTSESVCFFDAPGQVQAIADFVSFSVIPTIFPDISNPANWALKEIRDVATSDPAFPNSVEFLMANFKIAVPNPRK